MMGLPQLLLELYSNPRMPMKIIRYMLVASLFTLMLLACSDSNANPYSEIKTVETYMDEATEVHNHSGIRPATNTDVLMTTEKQDDTKVHQWLVGTADVVTQAQIQEASKFLQSLTNTVPKQILRSDGLFLFWVVNMTKCQSIQAWDHPAITTVELNLKLVDARVLPRSTPFPKERRDVQYETQQLAVRELVAISQPSGVPDVNLFKNYVYENHAGSKSFIYHVEYGVAFGRHAAEFPKVAATILTAEAQRKGMKGDDDNSQTFHSTCTADKAVGQQYGVAKKATLIPVILAEDDLAELTAAFEEVANDLQAHVDRRGFSVVSLSLVTDGPGGREAALLSRAIGKVMLLDVPVVVSAGNFGSQPGREEIDTYPALLASRDYPLIVVGSCNLQGERSEFSQVGHELTLYAVGEDVTCFEHTQSVPSTGNDGTSFSAPLVAGEVAVLLSHDQVPVDTSEGNLVRNMRDYLKTNDEAGWVRSGDIRVLWNGVTEDKNPRFKVCAGLAANKYVSRETLRAAIQDDFCNAPLNNPFSRRYHEGTMEDVVISLVHDSSTPDTRVLDKESCVRYLLAEVTDGCDGNDPTGNPSNYKGGGSATLGGVSYRIEPMSLRQPANRPQEGSHGCQSQYKFLWNHFVVWGHGWASGDFGKAFRDEIAEHCSLESATWSFAYGLGEDGREWTASFRTAPFNKACVSWAAKTVGAPEEFTCDGSG